jgi:cation:H+ antiporter
MIVNLIIFSASLAVLVVAGNFLVKGAISIALKIHMSPMVVGLTIIAFGTSAPELFISINSALKGSPDIAMGNVVGSNICNLTLVLGIAAVISPMLVKPNFIKIDWPVAMGSGILLYLFSLDETLQTHEGIIFLVILIIYLYLIIRKSRKDIMAVMELEKELAKPKVLAQPLWKDLFFIIAGCAGLYFGSDWFVEAAIILAEGLGVSQRVIGISIVALGTSLPELVTAAIAAYRKQTDLALGNLIGSNIFNIFSILGITAIIKDIDVNIVIINYDFWWMLGITAVILPIMLIQKNINRIEGFFLLVVYIVYMFLLF